MRRIKRRIAAGIAAVALVAVPAAVAHDSQWLNHGGGGKGRVTGHNWLTKCDTQVDGHKVYIRFHTLWMQPDDEGRNWAISGYAPSGGCSTEGSAPYGDTVTSFSVCVQEEGCVGPRDHSSNW